MCLFSRSLPACSSKSASNRQREARRQAEGAAGRAAAVPGQGRPARRGEALRGGRDDNTTHTNMISITDTQSEQPTLLFLHPAVVSLHSNHSLSCTPIVLMCSMPELTCCALGTDERCRLARVRCLGSAW